MREIIIGVICSIISSIITWMAVKAYNGGKHFGGVFRLIRLIIDCYRAGIINVFPNRKAYSCHKDHGTGAEYIKKCEHSLYYVGYWLASSITMGEIINSFKELAQKRISITVVFLDPSDTTTIESCSRFLAITTEELTQRVNYSIKKLFELKKELDNDIGKYITIKLHHVPLSASAFIIQQPDPKTSKILVDYKLYNFCRDESFGIEYQDKDKEITQKIMGSYLHISDEADIYPISE